MEVQIIQTWHVTMLSAISYFVCKQERRLTQVQLLAQVQSETNPEAADAELPDTSNL